MMANPRSLLCALGLAAFCAPAGAAVKQTTGTWLKMSVTLSSPADKVTRGTPFDLSFLMDNTPAGANSDPAVFLTTVSFSNAVDLSAAHWSYQLTSLNPPNNGSFSGNLGDAFAPVSGNYLVRLVDPFPSFACSDCSGYTWLSGTYEDKALWTFTNIIINADTTVGLTIDDEGITGASALSATVLVIDPPPVPELPPVALLLAGLGVVGWRRLRSAGGPASAS